MPSAWLLNDVSTSKMGWAATSSQRTSSAFCLRSGEVGGGVVVAASSSSVNSSRVEPSNPPALRAGSSARLPGAGAWSMAAAASDSSGPAQLAAKCSLSRLWTMKAVESAWVAWVMAGSRWMSPLVRSLAWAYSSKSGVRSGGGFGWRGRALNPADSYRSGKALRKLGRSAD